MASTWQITDQIPNQYGPTVGTSPILGVRVEFITGAGWRSSVWVADDHYTPAEVKAAITAKVAVVDAVGALKHTG
jgi:hypothetical protein